MSKIIKQKVFVNITKIYLCGLVYIVILSIFIILKNANTEKKKI